MSSSRVGGASTPRRRRRSGVLSTKAIESVWIPVMITLLASNLVGLFVHVWYFLPHHDGAGSSAADSGSSGGGGGGLVKSQAEEGPTRCGCSTCTPSVFDRMAKGYPVKNRVGYMIKNMGQSEEDACFRVCGEEFPDVCGKECNPQQCGAAGSSSAGGFFASLFGKSVGGGKNAAQEPPQKRILSPAKRAIKNFKKRVRTEKESIRGGENVDAARALRKEIMSHNIVPYNVVPQVLEEVGFYGVVHQLPSIPDRRRMIVLPRAKDGDAPNENGETITDLNPNDYFVPKNAVHNLTYFLESRLRPDEEDRPLFLYNPMILPMDPKTIADSILEDVGNGKGNDAAYIAVFRVSNFGNCHGAGRGVPDTYHNYLGLALLDADLNILRDEDNGGQHHDVVIDLNQHLFDVRWSPWMGRGGRIPTSSKQFMQDCQLTAAPSKGSEKSDRLIMICNEYAMQIRLRRTTTKEGGDLPPNGKKMIHFQNKYGSGLEMTALERPTPIIMKGKNLHFFQAERPNGEKMKDGGFLEIWPGGPHETLHMDFVHYPFNDLHPHVNYNDVSLIKTMKATQELDPPPSFKGVDTPLPGTKGPLISRDSGSTCCVPINWKDPDTGKERRLFLGFSHRKGRKGLIKKAQYNYVSRVYAFEPSPPFNIVARSGFFCLGFVMHATDEARQSDNEQIYGAANYQKLAIAKRLFECPKIHFITGIVEKLGDEDTVIISYGINDCFPRMIEVPKSFLVSLLQPSSEEE